MVSEISLYGPWLHGKTITAEQCGEAKLLTDYMVAELPAQEKSSSEAGPAARRSSQDWTCVTYPDTARSVHF